MRSYTHPMAFLSVLMLFVSLLSCDFWQKGTRLFFKHGEAQLEVIASDGTRILVDVSARRNLSSLPKDTDILLTTHSHEDHYIPDFVNGFKGQKLTFERGEISQGKVHITSMVSCHGDGYDPAAAKPSNFIFIIDVDGLRIVHFGDVGQTAFTPEQLQKLGQVDIAVTQFGNEFSAMNITNKKGFNLMDQVNPGIIIPTHVDVETYEYALKKYPSYLLNDGFVTVNKNRIPTKTVFFAFGNVGKYIGGKLNYQFKKW